MYDEVLKQFTILDTQPRDVNVVIEALICIMDYRIVYPKEFTDCFRNIPHDLRMRVVNNYLFIVDCVRLDPPHDVDYCERTGLTATELDRVADEVHNYGKSFWVY